MSEQIELITPPTPLPVPPRPTPRDSEVRRAAAYRLWPRLKEILESADDLVEEDTVNEVASVINLHDDGYCFMKELERRFHWYGDLETCEVLDGASLALFKALHNAEADWVKRFAIQPKLQLGEQIKFKGKSNQLEEGVILEVQPNGYYQIFSESLGHVKRSATSGTLSIGLRWEDVEACNQPTVESYEK